MTNVWRAQVRVAPASGFCQVRRVGETSNRTVAIARTVASAVVGEWVLVIEDGGQAWATVLLGIGPTAIFPDPDPGPNPGPSVVNVPATWYGGSRYDAIAGTPSRWWIGTSNSYYFGRTYLPSVPADQRSKAIGCYLGLKGLTITEAKLTIVSASTLATSTALLALFLVPEQAPTSDSLAAPADTPVATIAAPTFPTPKAGTTVTLPAGWLTHLSAGTANAIGFTDPTGWHAIKPVPTLQITYS